MKAGARENMLAQVALMKHRPTGLLLVMAIAYCCGNACANAEEAGLWKVGMSAALSGPAKALGNGMRHGIEAYFEQVNRNGGIHGRDLKLICRDDAYEPAKTAPNMRYFAETKRVFACIGNVGTPTAAVAFPIAIQNKLPLIGAFSGAGILRKSPPDRYVINYRASYAEEIAEMIDGLIGSLDITPDQIGFFTQNDAYGDAGWSGGMAALEKRGYANAKRLPHGRYRRNTTDVEGGLSRLLDPRFDVRAVIMVGAYKPCAKFIRLARQHHFNPIFLNVSFVGSDALLAELGDAGEGVIVTQVVPLPEGDTVAAKEFRGCLSSERRSFVSFEGFLAAKAFVMALDRAGRDADPEALIDTIESGRAFDLGLGPIHKLSKTEHQFSHRVWPTVIRSGRFVALDSWKDVDLGGKL
jgi:ABC-type branched-subunit amino acid transport system substrate-binding protein